MTSFTFYQEEPDESPVIDDEESHRSDIGDIPFGEEVDEEDWDDLERQASDNDYILHRRASTMSRASVHSRLLRRDSGLSAVSVLGEGRLSQKIYMANEDLYIVVAGFRTSRTGLAIYSLLCVMTLGLAWLLFRWIPRWHVKLVGQPAPLRESQWVVIEVSIVTGRPACRGSPCNQNQWNEMAILNVDIRQYDRTLSTVFGAPDKMTSYFLGEDQDPIMKDLRMLNYRYVRLYLHPLKDKFVLCNGWKDPLWTDVRAVRAGIDNEEQLSRDIVFGDNLVDIEQKSIFRLLVDEVCLLVSLGTQVIEC
jgi:cation-transporting ATPase 13A3/4/5